MDILRKEKDRSDEDLKKVVQMHKQQIDMHKSHSLQTFRAYKLVYCFAILTYFCTSSITFLKLFCENRIIINFHLVKTKDYSSI